MGWIIQVVARGIIIVSTVSYLGICIRTIVSGTEKNTSFFSVNHDVTGRVTEGLS